MSHNTIIFVNKDATNINQLFLDEEWHHNQLFENIFSISISNKNLGWLVKIYNKTKHAKKESDNLHKLQLINGIPKLLAVGLSKSFNYIILSQAPGLDLFEYTKKFGFFSEESVKPIILQILTILNSIHSKKIIHMDIKPENIIYDNLTNKITIIDFECKSTDDYRSPEQILKKPISIKTDLWSMGISIYYITHGKIPFKSIDSILHKNPTYSKKFSEEFTDFLNCLIEKNTSLRYNSNEALNHPWLSS